MNMDWVFLVELPLSQSLVFVYSWGHLRSQGLFPTPGRVKALGTRNILGRDELNCLK